MKLRINVIDAFTDTPFKGNPAAVIVLPTTQWLSDELMQAIASENNLSETAFVKQVTTAQSHLDSRFDIRWFSPMSEIDFCGHATLAASFVIFSANPALDRITFYAQAVGDLAVTRAANGAFEMNFPNRMPCPIANASDIPADLLAGLSITPVAVLQNQQAYFAIFENEADIYTLTYDETKLQSLAPYDVVVTAKSAQYDFISRYFWPANGGQEDPVTGSIHAGLAPYWADKLGKTQLNAFQASARSGLLSCRVDGDRVFVSGHAVEYLVGEITV